MPDYDSQLSFLLATGSSYIPSAQEATRLRGVVVELEQKLEQHEKTMEQLSDAKQKLQRDIAAYRTVLSPVRRLPPEILGEIFAQCIDYHLGGYCSPTPRAAPIILVGINQHWRQVALYTPKLWSSLDIIFTKGNAKALIVLLYTWIIRSKSCPLSLSFSAYPDALSETATDVLADILRSCHHRVQELRLSLPDPVITAILRHATMPLLVTFSLQGVHDSSNNLALDLTPSNHLKILDIYMSCSSIQVAAHWHTLTSLSVETAEEKSAKDWLDRLAACPALVECDISIYRADEPQHLVVGPIVNSLSLERLKILSTPDLLRPFLDGIRLPSLATLEIDGLTSSTVLQADGLSGLLFRSGCTLTSLTLQDTEIVEDTLLALFPLLPSLLELHLDVSGSPFTDAVFDRLTYRPWKGTGGVPALPKLHTLGLTAYDSFSHRRLVDVIQSRWRLKTAPIGSGSPVAPLQRVAIYMPDDRLRKKSAARLAAMEREGLRVEAEVDDHSDPDELPPESESEFEWM